jgi:uncharacterized protein (TIGR02145 family)
LVIADTTPENADTAIKIQNLVSIKTPAIEKIANWGEADNTLSEPTTQDYADADVDITNVHLDIINLILLEIGFNESDTTAEIQTLVSIRAAAITLIANYADSNGSTTQPTQQTYIDAQVVNIDTLSYVSLANAAVQAATIDEVNTTAKIQILVDNAILVSSDALNKIANWTTLSPAEDEPTLADYTTAGVLNVDDNNLAIVNSVMSFIEFEQSNTLELIQTLVDTKAKSIELIADYANRNGDDSAPTALNYETAGVEITNADINIVDLVLTDTQILFEHADTTLEIQGLVSVNAAAIQLISTYTQDTSNPPSLIDYTNAGIINLDEIQVATVNIAVNATSTAAAADTRLKIQAIVDNATQLYTTSFAIINYWGEPDNELDEPTIQDYANIGVFEVVDTNLNIVNIVISDATFDATDTPTKIQTLISVKAIAISKISTYADNNTASPTVQDYIDAGVVDVDTLNLSLTNATIKNTTSEATDTTEEIQALIDAQASPSTSSFTLNPSSVDLNADPNYLGAGVYLQVKDSKGNNFTTGGLNVKMWNEDTANVTATVSNVIDNKNGTYYVLVQNTVVASVVIKASINGTTVESRAIPYFYDNQPPVFTSPANTTTEVPEGVTDIVLTFQATDITSHQYHLDGNAYDNNLFNINIPNGTITFKNPPDFEHPQDDNKDNIYGVRVYSDDQAGNKSYSTQYVEVTNIPDFNDFDAAFTGGNFNGLEYEVVVYSSTGRAWLDRNLGASRVATKENDSEAYGDYYQWGRAADGHEDKDSSETETLSGDITPDHSKFIKRDDYSDYDWTKNGVDDSGSKRVSAWADAGENDICPFSFEVPTNADWQAELDALNIEHENDAFEKMGIVMAGYRESNGGGFEERGKDGRYTIRDSASRDNLHRILRLDGDEVFLSDSNPANGLSVRCIRKLFD